MLLGPTFVDEKLIPSFRHGSSPYQSSTDDSLSYYIRSPPRHS